MAGLPPMGDPGMGDGFGDAPPPAKPLPHGFGLHPVKRGMAHTLVLWHLGCTRPLSEPP